MPDVKLIGDEDINKTTRTSSNYFYLYKYTAIASGVATYIKVKTYSPGSSGGIKVAIYSDSGGEPSTLLSQATATISASGWNIINIPSVSITSGNAYWLAFNSENVYSQVVRDETVNRARRLRSATYSSFSFPNPAGTGFTSSDTYNPAIQVWSTPSGGVGLIGPGLVGPSPLIGKHPLVSW